MVLTLKHNITCEDVLGQEQIPGVLTDRHLWDMLMRTHQKGEPWERVLKHCTHLFFELSFVQTILCQMVEKAPLIQENITNVITFFKGASCSVMWSGSIFLLKIKSVWCVFVLQLDQFFCYASESLNVCILWWRQHFFYGCYSVPFIKPSFITRKFFVWWCCWVYHSLFFFSVPLSFSLSPLLV